MSFLSFVSLRVLRFATISSMSEQGFRSLVIGTALSFGILISLPQLLYFTYPLSQGLPVELNSDEDLYLSRVTEALEGRPEQSAEAIIGDIDILPLQGAFLEEWEGRLFAWTGLTAAGVFQILDAVIPPLLFLTLFWFLRLSGFSLWVSFSGAALFCLLELYNLNRPVHQRESFLLVLLALCFLVEGVRGRRILGFFGGVILGTLVGIYFWSWTFAWAWAGLLLFWLIYERILEKKHEHPGFFSQIPCALSSRAFPRAAFLAVARPVSSDGRSLRRPARHNALRRFQASAHGARSSPSGTVAFPGAGIVVPNRTLPVAGSWGLGAFVVTKELRKRCALVGITVLTAFIVLHQQVIHGVVFLFSSHYLFPLVLAGVMVFLLSVLHIKDSKWLVLSLVGSLLFLLGIAYDGRYVINYFRIDEGRFTEQHLASALPELRRLPRTTILSDVDTMRFLASHTKHDVPYSARLNYMLIRDEELAERYCLAKIALPMPAWRIEEDPVLFYDPDVIETDPQETHLRASPRAADLSADDHRSWNVFEGVRHHAYSLGHAQTAGVERQQV